MTNEGKVEVELLSIGARINKFMVDGVDIVLGFNTDPSTVNLTGTSPSPCWNRGSRQQEVRSPLFCGVDIAKQTYGATHGRVCRSFGLPIQYNGQPYVPENQDLSMVSCLHIIVVSISEFATL